MTERQDQGFATLVREKYDQAHRMSECVEWQTQVGAAVGGFVERVYLIDPASETKHSIQRQGFSRQESAHLFNGYSHILETSGKYAAPVAEGMTMEVDPQRILVDRKGGVSLLSRREVLPISSDYLSETEESLERSEPYPVGQVATLSLLDIESAPTFEDRLMELLASENTSLHERAQTLLRSGFMSTRYVKFERINPSHQFPDLLDSFSIVRAIFDAENGVKGRISNVIEDEPRRLSPDSIEVALQFVRGLHLPTTDGEIFGDTFDISIERHDAYVQTPIADSGFTGLSPAGLELVSRVIDSAILIPIRR